MVVLNELLPESSSSSSTDDRSNFVYKYDVFLSFRGADTRHAFTDHLYNALTEAAGVMTFLDNEDIETGKPLKQELESAIKSSRLSRDNFGQIVFPVFYGVEPSDVRKQQSSFGEAMKMHKTRMEAEVNAEKRSEMARKMELRKNALKEVGNLSGWANINNR
ncbi:toll/interleukin-1 receptor-like protein [Bidens hawaiensis]|uniref:toll/interleukin-1 receptor-like protein n=1 Tax=Bidens hawaiensis TaxID=980011 RepID=UPI00404B6EE9